MARQTKTSLCGHLPRYVRALFGAFGEDGLEGGPNLLNGEGLSFAGPVEGCNLGFSIVALVAPLSSKRSIALACAP